MALDPSIILAGQAPDILGATQRGLQTANMHGQMIEEGRLRNLYRDQGAAIAAGDKAALNALAQYDPAAAISVQDALLGLDQKRVGLETARRQMDAMSEQSRLEAEKFAATLSKQEAEAKAAEIEKGVKRALMATTPEQFDALMVELGQPEMVGQFENREMLAAEFLGFADILKMNAPPAPQSAEGKLAADIAAGILPPGTTKSPGVVVQIGDQEPKIGQVYQPGEVQAVLDMIDGISNDPNLPSVVGTKAVFLGGGNNIGDMNMTQRVAYGEDQLATIERIGQLQSNTWIAAREMLKGGGQITDYESRKAEGAVARLERTKSLEEFRVALQDLRDAIVAGMEKLRAARGEGGAAPAEPGPSDPAKPPKAVVIDGFTIEALE